jgi:hypothetical protein
LFQLLHKIENSHVFAILYTLQIIQVSHRASRTACIVIYERSISSWGWSGCCIYRPLVGSTIDNANFAAKICCYILGRQVSNHQLGFVNKKRSAKTRAFSVKEPSTLFANGCVLSVWRGNCQSTKPQNAPARFGRRGQCVGERPTGICHLSRQ